MVHLLCSYVFCSSPLLLTEGEKYSKGVRRHIEKENEKIEIDGQEKAEISVGARRERKDDKEKRNLERRVIHFYGSKTHYLLIRAHTFFSV